MGSDSGATVVLTVLGTRGKLGVCTGAGGGAGVGESVCAGADAGAVHDSAVISSA